MSEFEVAVAFAREFAQAVALARRWNAALDDGSEHRRFCEDLGLDPTPERLALARDVTIACEYFTEAGRVREPGPEAGSRGGFEACGAGVEDDIPVWFLLDALECHGWRADHLLGRATLKPCLRRPDTAS